MLDRGEVTRLLDQLNGGDSTAIERIVPLVYDELHRMAQNKLRIERCGHTLQPTALVHEAYLRMIHQRQPDYQGRTHFLAIAARVMRQILVDHSRRVNAVRRGGEKRPLDEVLNFAATDEREILDLDIALTRLEEHDAIMAQLIEMRYFGGLTAEESASLTKLEVPDVRRRLRVAQAWLAREMGAAANSAPA